MRKILFCYFSQKDLDYTPTDIGYWVALLHQAYPNKYDIEIIQLSYEYLKDMTQEGWDKLRHENIKRDIALILYHRPDAVFFCIEHVLWSKVFAFGRTKSIIASLRLKAPELYIGIQSYKISPDQVRDVLMRGNVNCIVNGDPEHAFVCIEDIILNRTVPGVKYLDEAGETGEPLPPAAVHHQEKYPLDTIPSPYLNHVFDNFIQDRQLRSGNMFRAFLVSSRGCRFGCYYCYRSVKYERVRFFSPRRFYDELEYLHDNFGVKLFFVLDDAFLFSKERLTNFVSEFQRRKKRNQGLNNIKLYVMARPESIDREVVNLLAKLRVVWIQIGLQTAHPGLQEYMNRKMDIDHFQSIASLLHEYRIALWLDIVIGLPGDTIEALQQTIQFALSLKPDAMQVKQFYLNPNTHFAKQAETYGIEIEKNDRDFDVPYVLRSRNVDQQYYDDAHAFIMNAIETNPKIRWKYISRQGNYRSDQYFQ